MEKGDKRGLSDVITTIIIILLSIAAIGIVWVVVQNLISSGSEDIGTEKFSIDINFVKASIKGDYITMTVKRATGAGNVSGIKFIISDGSDSEDFTEKQGLTELQEKTFTITLKTLNFADVKTASIAPIYTTNSGKEKLGSVTDTYNFKASDISNGTISNESGGDVVNGSIECIPSCTGGQTCHNGVCISSECTETRTDVQVCTAKGVECGNTLDACGNYINCDAAIGGCTNGETCNNGVCIPAGGCAETRTDVQVCTAESAICGKVRDACGNYVNCDAAIGGCSSTEKCIANNTCQKLIFVTGTVYSVWPEGIGIYFDSEDLPEDQLDFVYYVKFLPPSQESECLLIEDYQLPQPPQTRVIIRLLATQTRIAAGDSFELWPTYEACIA